jgi:molecular chaperone GrpE
MVPTSPRSRESRATPSDMSDYDDDPGRPDVPPNPTDPDALVRRVAELEAELAAARDEARQAQDRWLRERADMDNLKKRTARERQDAVRFGNETLLRDLLPVLDNLERALAAAGGGSGQSLVDGVELIRKGLVDALQRHGVERVSAVGERFDPAHHEAVAQIESPSHEAQHVVVEHQAGYRLNDRLLRPAMVTVSKGRSSDGKLANEEGGG